MFHWDIVGSAQSYLGTFWAVRNYTTHVILYWLIESIPDDFWSLFHMPDVFWSAGAYRGPDGLRGRTSIGAIIKSENAWLF